MFSTNVKLNYSVFNKRLQSTRNNETIPVSNGALPHTYSNLYLYNPLNNMGQNSSKDVEINGTVSPGFESVKEMFISNFNSGREESAQLCVYVGDEKVIDLWASTTNSNYTADTLTNVFSSTKSLTAIAMATLYDKGILKYDSKIPEYWPEFAENGKDQVTVADLMRHQAGLAKLDVSLDVADSHIENIKKNSIGKILEKQKLTYPEWGRREYHGITRGWIANEIFRRVHTEGKTIGEFVNEDLHAKLGADVFIGVDQKAKENYAPVRDMNFSFVLGQSLIPSYFNSAVDVNVFEFVTFLNKLRKLMSKSGDLKPAFAPCNDISMEKNIGPFFNLDDVRIGQTPSANGNCSARGFYSSPKFYKYKHLLI